MELFVVFTQIAKENTNKLPCPYDLDTKEGLSEFRYLMFEYKPVFQKQSLVTILQIE